MPEVILSDYFYGDEAEQFQFFRIPRQLMTNLKFKNLSADAKLLYGMMLDRMSLSAKNGWYDGDNRVYIYYTVEEVCSDLNCGINKAIKLLAELDTGKGVGLIERIKQGQGRPCKIFVKRFTLGRNTTRADTSVPSPRHQDLDDPKALTFEIQSSRPLENKSADLSKAECNDTKSNQTEFSHTDPSITLTRPRETTGTEMDRYEKRGKIKENIDYPYLQRQYPYDDVECLLELILEVICSTATTMRIGGEELPTEKVKRRFMQLERGHIEHVIESMKKTTTKINNIRAYLLTTLYNALVTIGTCCSATVRHNFG